MIMIRIDVPELRPDESREQITSPPSAFRLRGIEVHVSVGDPDPGVFHRRRGAKGSRRKGRLASQAWAITRLRMHEDPHRFSPSATLDQVRIGASRHLLTPVPISFLRREDGYGTSGSWVDVVVRASVDLRVTLSNRDCRPMSITLVLWGQDPNTHGRRRVVQGP